MDKSLIYKALKEVPSFNISIDSIYKNNDNKSVPRVTEVLSETMDSSYLIKWANGLGLKGQVYEKVLNEAAEIGIEAHATIEKYIILSMEKKEPPKNDNYPYCSFLKWFDDISSNNTVTPIYSELSLCNDYVGGTLDLLIEINGRKYIVDFKTSNHIYEKYYLQLAAYRWLLYCNYNIEIDGVIILQLNKTNVSYNEYVLDFRYPKHLYFMNECHNAFLSLLYAYYNTHHIKEIYNEIRNEK